MDKQIKITFSIFIAIFLVLLIWPKITILGKFEPTDSIKNKLEFGAWNKGAIIEGFYVFTPEVCFSAELDNNISCTHEGYSGTSNCSRKICGKAPAGEASREEEFYLSYPYEKPSNFTIKVKALAILSILPVWSTSEEYFCKLNEDSVYNCEER